MIRRLYRSLPGPAWARTVATLLVVIAVLALLVLGYEWAGDTFLDSGGGIG